MECSATLIPGAYTLHWTPLQALLKRRWQRVGTDARHVVQGMECSATLIPGAYTLHWTPLQALLKRHWQRVGTDARHVVQGMECSATLIPGAYTLHWTPQQGGVNITAVAAGKGFVGLGWTADPGQMIGSHAIIGWVNDDSTKHVTL